MSSAPAKANKSRLMRTKEAAQYLAVSPWKIRQLVQASQLLYIEDVERSPWRFDVRELDAYIERSAIKQQ